MRSVLVFAILALSAPAFAGRSNCVKDEIRGEYATLGEREADQLVKLFLLDQPEKISRALSRLSPRDQVRVLRAFDLVSLGHSDRISPPLAELKATATRLSLTRLKERL